MSGVLLATAGYDHTIRLWEAPSGVCYKTMQHPDSQVNKLEITPDKRYIAAAGNPSLRIFDINGSSPNALSSYDGHTNNITAVGFQKEGKWMFTGSEDGTIKIWDMRAPGCQREYESGSPLNTVMLHPNQAELISGDRDGNIRVWDLTQNACSAELVPDGAKAIRSVCISRDASLLAAANDAGSCFVWRSTAKRPRLRSQQPMPATRRSRGPPTRLLPPPPPWLGRCASAWARGCTDAPCTHAPRTDACHASCPAGGSADMMTRAPIPLHYRYITVTAGGSADTTTRAPSSSRCRSCRPTRRTCSSASCRPTASGLPRAPPTRRSRYIEMLGILTPNP